MSDGGIGNYVVIDCYREVLRKNTLSSLARVTLTKRKNELLARSSGLRTMMPLVRAMALSGWDDASIMARIRALGVTKAGGEHYGSGNTIRHWRAKIRREKDRNGMRRCWVRVTRSDGKTSAMACVGTHEEIGIMLKVLRSLDNIVTCDI